MTISKRIFLILFIQLLPFALFSQKAWIMNDSLMRIIDFRRGSDIENAQICREIRNDSVYTYTPYDLKWYRYGQRFYLAKEIQFAGEAKRVFIERLVTGKISLYYYSEKNLKRFYIEQEGSYFTELIKESKSNTAFRDTLAKYSLDCNNITDAVKSVKYNRKSLAQFIEMYNGCEYRPFQYSKFGMYLGFQRSYLSISSKNSTDSDALSGAKFNTDQSLLVGIFVDLPVLKSNITFHPEIYYTKNAFSSHHFQNNFDTDIVINLSTLNVPVLFRYTFPFRQFRPFINSGIVYSYHLRNEKVIYKSQMINNVVEIQQESPESLMLLNQLKISVGMGFQYMINYRKSVFCEFRYNSHSSFESKLNLDNINLNVGVIF